MPRATMLALTLMLLPACFPKSGPPPGELDELAVQSASERWPGTTAESLEQGRQIFVAQCGECHDHPDLAAFPESEWPATARRMAEDKAELSSDDAALLVRYVQVATASN